MVKILRNKDRETERERERGRGKKSEKEDGNSPPTIKMPLLRSWIVHDFHCIRAKSVAPRR
jgi:hypothetical protein